MKYGCNKLFNDSYTLFYLTVYSWEEQSPYLIIIVIIIIEKVSHF